METKNIQTDTRSLKKFLIQRFLGIMLFIFISEELLNIGYRLVVVPFLAEIIGIRELSIITDGGNIVLLMLQMFLLSAAMLLPETAAGWVQNRIGQKMEGGLRIGIALPALENINNPRLLELYRIAIILIFLGLFFLTLLPYLISAYWYYKAVSGKVRELLQAEKEQKEEHDRQRNLLLSDIAHDIKTPITTVCGYARALADDVVTEEEKRKEYLQAIYAKSMRMDELVTLLFEYVKLDSDGFALNPEEADLGELLRENVALLYSDFEENGMELEIEIPEQTIPYKMDIIQMERAVTNILTNAVKYNEKGTKISVSLRISADAGYRIRIADNGTPIDDNLAKYIFEPFARGDKARSTGGGNGLGLSISSKIVRMHGGELKLNRQCEDGYVKAFEILLP